MGMFAAVWSVYANMFNFSGRARRAEYWLYFLFLIVINSAVSVAIPGLMLMQAFGWDMPGNEAAIEALLTEFRGPILTASGGTFVVMLFGVIIPQLAVTVRRLHDTGRSGWWMFKPLLVCIVAVFGLFFAAMFSGGDSAAGLMAVAVVIPLACYIWYMVVMCLPGDYGDNRFGPDPVEGRSPADARHPALVKEMDEDLSRPVAERRREEFKDYYRARVAPAIDRNRTRRV